MTQTLPRHVAVIMDGNGRWAARRHLPRSAGHAAGCDNFRVITRHAERRGIKHLSLYVFSTENWSRPKSEVDGLMRLFEKNMREALSDFKDENIRVSFLGGREPFSADLRTLMKRVEDETREKTGMRLNLAVNYGGKDDIVRAARELARRVKDGELTPDQIDEALFSQCLYTGGQPDVDLLIRTGGDKRISNFLLWQSAYAELAVTDTFWPDFTPAEFDAALEDFAKRERRFGNAKEQAL